MYLYVGRRDRSRCIRALSGSPGNGHGRAMYAAVLIRRCGARAAKALSKLADPEMDG